MTSKGKWKVEKLYKEAEEMTKGHEWQSVDVFYRNKPKAYYDVILRTTGIMGTRLKDKNGDKDCPINGRLKGRFFAANNPFGRSCQKNNLPKSSPFGDTRLVLPTTYFGLDCNLYFADVYCHKPGGLHYIQIVMTKQNSSADAFCSQYLVKLDITDNPFLKRISSETGRWKALRKIWVELFYTESVNVTDAIDIHGAYMETVESTGTARPMGIPKNKQCTVCNVSEADMGWIENNVTRRNVSHRPSTSSNVHGGDDIIYNAVYTNKTQKLTIHGLQDSTPLVNKLPKAAKTKPGDDTSRAVVAAEDSARQPSVPANQQSHVRPAKMHRKSVRNRPTDKTGEVPRAVTNYYNVNQIYLQYNNIARTDMTSPTKSQNNTTHRRAEPTSVTQGCSTTPRPASGRTNVPMIQDEGFLTTGMTSHTRSQINTMGHGQHSESASFTQGRSPIRTSSNRPTSGIAHRTNVQDEGYSTERRLTTRTSSNIASRRPNVSSRPVIHDQGIYTIGTSTSITPSPVAAIRHEIPSRPTAQYDSTFLYQPNWMDERRYEQKRSKKRCFKSFLNLLCCCFCRRDTNG